MSTFSKSRKITFRKALFYSHIFFHTDYRGLGEMTRCNGFLIDPKCVCAYDMYTSGINDIFKRTALRKNGSLDHVNVKIVCAYILVEILQ